ncbi:MAG: BrnT family toxin, partial [Microcystis sp.]
GIVNQVVLFVVYTKRNGRYRIISARRANKNERRQYYQS